MQPISKPSQQPATLADGKPIDPVAVANAGLSLFTLSPAAQAPVLYRPPPLLLQRPGRGRRVAKFGLQQLQQLSDALEAVANYELKVRHPCSESEHVSMYAQLGTCLSHTLNHIQSCL